MKSDESDYMAETMFANVSHDMFGDLTTISFGFKNGQNEVFRNVKIDGVKVNDPTFAEEMESKSFNVSRLADHHQEPDHDRASTK